MAWVTSIELKDGSGKIQPTQLVVSAKFFSVESGARILQLDSFGSSDRKIQDKQSQTLQFGEAAAHQLYRILKDTYKFQD
jgi:hypothetical protein